MAANSTQQRREHIKRLLGESGELSADQVKELVNQYNIGSSNIYCDVALLKKSPTYYRIKATHQVGGQNSRARKKGIKGQITADEWRELCERCDNICLCCGQKKPLTLDHVVPLSQGGSNTIDNVQPLCWDCNQDKGIQTVDYR